MKKLLLITISFFLLTQAANASFTDVGLDNARMNAIEYLQAQNVITGYDDGTYKPTYFLTRAEALKMIVKAKNYSLPSSIPDTHFIDVSAGDWYAQYVVAAYDNGIISVPDNQKFRPDDAVSRAELIKMTLLAYNFSTANWEDRQIYSDVPSDAWFTPYMNYAGQAGIVAKDNYNNLFPSLSPDRAETAGIIYSAILIANKTNSSFLSTQADNYLTQVKTNLSAGNVITAKKTSEMFVSITQQMYRNHPTDKITLAKAKIAKAYNYYVNAAIQKDKNNITKETYFKNLALVKATEASAQNAVVSSDAMYVTSLSNEL